MTDTSAGPGIASVASRAKPRARWIKTLASQLPSWLVLVLLGILSVPPLVMVIGMSFRDRMLSPEAHWSLVNYEEVLGDLIGGGPLLNTVVFAVGSASLALLFGGVLAFITERTDTPMRRLGYFTAITVVAIPAPVYAFAWALLFGRQGPINYGIAGLGELIGVDLPSISINNLGGMIFVEGLSFSALSFFLLVGPMRSIDRSLEEAALTSGAHGWQVMLKITGPMMLPGILAVLILNFVRGMEAFAVPAMIGAAGNVSVLTTEIFYAITQSQPPQYGIAAVHGVILVLLVVALLLIYTSMTAQAARFATITGKGFRARLIETGRKRRILSSVMAIFFLVSIVAPLFILIFASLQGYYGGMYVSELTFRHYADVLSYRRITEAFWNSFIVGAGAAMLIMLLTTVAAWLSIRGQGRIRQSLDFVASLPLALPGTVLGLALLAIFVRVPLPIYGTLAALVIAAVIRFLPYGFRYSHAGLLQVHSELEEAGLMSGANRLQVSYRIVLPLIAMPLAAGFIYVFLIAARELEASALLVTSRSPVIAPLLVDLYQNGSFSQLAAFSTMLILIYGALAYIVYFIARRYGLRI